MIALDWTAMVSGLAIGAAASVLFFAGLGFGMRLALRAARPVNILIVSAFVRITTLLGIGWAVAILLGPFAVAGFAAAFLISRLVATTMACAGMPAEGAL